MAIAKMKVPLLIKRKERLYSSLPEDAQIPVLTSGFDVVHLVKNPSYLKDFRFSRGTVVDLLVNELNLKPRSVLTAVAQVALNTALTGTPPRGFQYLASHEDYGFRLLFVSARHLPFFVMEVEDIDKRMKSLNWNNKTGIASDRMQDRRSKNN